MWIAAGILPNSASACRSNSCLVFLFSNTHNTKHGKSLFYELSGSAPSGIYRLLRWGITETSRL